MDSSGLLRELAPTVARLMDRHLATTKEWFPHQHIPYGRGRDYAADEVWCEEAAPTSAGRRSTTPCAAR